MNYIILMKKVNSFEDLIKNALDLRNIKHIISPYVPEIIINKLHYHKGRGVVVLIFRPSGCIQLIYSDNILMSKRL